MRKKVTRLIGLLIATMFLTHSSRAGDDQFILVDNHKARCSIVLPDASDPVEKHAAAELAHFLEKVTGAKIAVSSNISPGMYGVFLGTPKTCPEIEGFGALQEVEALSDDGFLLKTGTQGLLIAAKKPLGVLFGVYAFLEEHVGMRWFYPGEDGEYCPKNATLAVGPINDIQNPSFIKRIGPGPMSNGSKVVDTWDWTARNRLQTMRIYDFHKAEHDKRGGARGMGGHVLNKFIPDSLFVEHPEYFALINDKRVKQAANGRGCSQPCTTNPEVIKRSADYIIKYLKKFPDATFSIGNNDCGGWCQCERCVALDPLDERKTGSVSTRFTIFRNEVAKRVLNEIPNARLKTWAYQNYRFPSASVALNSKYCVRLCDHGRCYRHAISDKSCDANKWFRDFFEKWGEEKNPKGNFTYYGIYAGESHERTAGILCAQLEYIVADDMRYMYKNGFREWKNPGLCPDADYSFYNGYYDSPRTKDYWRANMNMIYVAAKLAWNIDADVDAILRDVNQKFYGPAADVMERYQAKQRELWASTPGHLIYGANYGALGKSVASPADFHDLQDLLDEAEKAAAGHPQYTQRVAKDKEIFKNGWALARQQYFQRKTNDVKAVRVHDSMEIDGKLDEPDWRICDAVGDFKRNDGKLAEHQTRARLLYDDDYVYVGLEMEEPKTNELSSECECRDDKAIWNDDHVELFLAPDAKGVKYYHLALNSKGVLRDSQCGVGSPSTGDINFNADAVVATNVKDGKWTAEVKIRATSLDGDVKDGGRWLMNVGRSRHIAPKENSTWSDGMFHNIDSFRGLDFSGPVVINGGFEDFHNPSEKQLQGHQQAGWRLENDPPRVPDKWKLHYNGGKAAGIVDEDVYSGKHALHVMDGIIYNPMNMKLKVGEQLRISFAARGQGHIKVSLYLYKEDPATRHKRIYEVTNIDDVELDPEWKLHTVNYAHPEGYPPFATLAFDFKGQGDIDDVKVVPLK